MALCETYKGNWISVQMSDSLLSPQFSNDDGWHTFQKDGSYQLVCARDMNYFAESVEKGAFKRGLMRGILIDGFSLHKPLPHC